jgi:hypothetical protein
MRTLKKITSVIIAFFLLTDCTAFSLSNIPASNNEIIKSSVISTLESIRACSISEQINEGLGIQDFDNAYKRYIGYKVVEFVVDYMASLDMNKSYSGEDFKELIKFFHDHGIREEGIDLSEMFAHLKTLADHSMRLNNTHIGHMLTTPGLEHGVRPRN